MVVDEVVVAVIVRAAITCQALINTRYCIVMNSVCVVSFNPYNNPV